jgi:hypothetical protein
VISVPCYFTQAQRGAYVECRVRGGRRGWVRRPPPGMTASPPRQ